jgi:hypothetical protein
MIQAKIIIELEWAKKFDTMLFRKQIEKILDEDSNLSSYSLYQK